jgi:MFS transporter, Spinster family, sphingosine-1-phosphate transporter
MSLFLTGCVKLSPMMIFLYLVLINFLMIIEKSGFSSLIPTFQEDDRINLSGFQSGILGSGLTLSMMLSGPVYAYLSQTINPLTLIGIGMSISCIALFLLSFAESFIHMVVARALLGIGDGCLTCLSIPTILAIAPSSKKNKWLGYFFIVSALGGATGYAYASYTKQALGDWHYVFFIESLVYIPAIIIALLAYKDSSLLFKKQQSNTSIFQQFKILSTNLVYVNIVIGRSATAFSAGALGFWGPTIIQKLYKQSEFVSLVSLGSLTIFGGILSIIIGTKIFDRMINKYRLQLESKEISSKKFDYIRTEKGSKLVFIIFLIGFTFVILAPAVAPALPGPMREWPFGFYMVFLAMGFFFLFM